MNKLKKVVLACSLAAGALCAGQIVQAAEGGPADGGQGWHGHGHRWHRGGMHRLHLSEAQRDQIFKLRYAQMPAMRDKFKQLRQVHQELRQLTLSDQYNADRASQLVNQEAQIRASLTLMRVDLRHKIYALLSPEQKKQLTEHRRPA